MVATFSNPRPLQLVDSRPTLELVPSLAPHRSEEEIARARLIVFALIGFVALTLMVFTLRSVQYGPTLQAAEQASVQAEMFEQYRVAEGDTVWSVVESRVDGDPRELVSQVIDINGSANLVEGQILQVPLAR